MLNLWEVLRLDCESVTALQSLTRCSFGPPWTHPLQANFLINGMHELGHGHVFRTKFFNGFFLRVISFLGWLHPDMFFSSHLRHHRYTQNEPYDQEAPMPVLPTVKDLLGFAFVNVKGFVEIFDQTWRAAFGRYPTGHLGWRAVWEDVCYPPSKPEARSPAQLWCDRYLPPCPLLRS
eukprot:m.261271 g.261271  ORF g.261271 m.261271 type:complete len:177 (-) comp26665_c0_seq2:186-716(-)